MTCSRTAAAAALLLFTVTPALGQFAWNEASDGDITGDRFAPLFLGAGLGSNTITGTVVTGDIDYFTFVVPAGAELVALNLLNYNSLDELAFVAVQQGNVFTVDAANPTPVGLLGYTLYGEFFEGLNILPDIGQGSGATGFTGPLPAGQYVFWNQQTGIEITDYTFEFVIVPAPGGLALLGSSGLLTLRRRR
jgi:hypothetical protein